MNAIDVRGKGAALGFQIRLIGFDATTDVEIKLVTFFGNIDKDREEALPSFLKNNGNPVATFDEAAQLKYDLAPVAQGATFDFLVGIIHFHNVCRRLKCIPIPDFARYGNGAGGSAPV